MVMTANAAGVANGFVLALTGVTKNVGPMTAACVSVFFGTPVLWLFFRPSLRSRWSVWMPSLLLGISMGVNNMAYQNGLRWVQLQLLQPLSFLFSAIFLVGPRVVRDARNGRYSTAMWPVLAGLGIWTLAADTAGGAGGAGGRAFTDAIPRLHVLGRLVPDWGLGLGILFLTAATYAYYSRKMEVFGTEVSGKINTLASIPAFVILALGAWAFESDWAGVTDGYWLYLLICACSGMFLSLLNGVVMVKAYARGLLASTTVMLSPLRTLLGTFLGMLAAHTAPGPLGSAAIGLILVASCGAAVIQSRKAGSE
ncbi:hypothetical protein AB0C84_37260 [Actinomadura sp. NPDC048955]|uniref:hypothetical protein n=1 Tax=Actinomadura sp. NPDC048955 TaxID=3158228 RepID=UPI0033EFF3F1